MSWTTKTRRSFKNANKGSVERERGFFLLGNLKQLDQEFFESLQHRIEEKERKVSISS